MLTPREVREGQPARIWSGDDLSVDAMQVPHGIVPAVAFRVESGDTSVVFASDQNLSDPVFAEYAKGASILVMHMVVPENVTGVGRSLHAPPSVIGKLAGQADPGRLVLSHFMARSLDDQAGNVAIVRQGFDGDIVLAEDLACVTP